MTSLSSTKKEIIVSLHMQNSSPKTHWSSSFNFCSQNGLDQCVKYVSQLKLMNRYIFFLGFFLEWMKKKIGMEEKLTGWFLGLYPSCCIIHLQRYLNVLHFMIEYIWCRSCQVPVPNVLHDEVFFI